MSLPAVRTLFHDIAAQLKILCNHVNLIATGGADNTGTVTLDNDASTTVVDSRVSPTSVVYLMPLNLVASTTTYFITCANGSFTITHSAAADRMFRYSITGS